jgi:hypothetical protein
MRDDGIVLSRQGVTGLDEPPQLHCSGAGGCLNNFCEILEKPRLVAVKVRRSNRITFNLVKPARTVLRLRFPKGSLFAS